MCKLSPEDVNAVQTKKKHINIIDKRFMGIYGLVIMRNNTGYGAVCGPLGDAYLPLTKRVSCLGNPFQYSKTKVA